MYKREELRNALEMLNKTLEYFELPKIDKIPQGARNNPRYCPVVKALGKCGVILAATKYVSVHNLDIAKALAEIWKTQLNCDDFYYVTNPNSLTDFICTFDRGGYPWLILKDQ